MFWHFARCFHWFRSIGVFCTCILFAAHSIGLCLLSPLRTDVLFLFGFPPINKTNKFNEIFDVLPLLIENWRAKQRERKMNVIIIVVIFILLCRFIHFLFSWKHITNYFYQIDFLLTAQWLWFVVCHIHLKLSRIKNWFRLNHDRAFFSFACHSQMPLRRSQFRFCCVNLNGFVICID